MVPQKSLKTDILSYIPWRLSSSYPFDLLTCPFDVLTCPRFITGTISAFFTNIFCWFFSDFQLTGNPDYSFKKQLKIWIENNKVYLKQAMKTGALVWWFDEGDRDDVIWIPFLPTLTSVPAGSWSLMTSYYLDRENKFFSQWF